jgi:flagellar export protein FliJ
MSRFAFRFETLLRQRAQTERRCQRDLAELQSRAAQLGSALAAAGDQFRGTTSIVSANRVGRLDTKLLIDGARFERAIRRKIDRLTSDLQSLQPRLERAHEALLEAAKQRKMLEKLREAKKVDWLAAREKAESRAVHEMSAAVTRLRGESA